VIPLLLLSLNAQANPTDLYGFGAEGMGRGQGGVAFVRDASAPMLNPAGLAYVRRPEVHAGFALLRMKLEDPPPVYWDTNRDGHIDDFDDPLLVYAPSEPADGFQVSFARPLLGRIGLGAAFFVPAKRLLRFQTFDPTLPTWFMYDNRPHRYAMALGAGAEILPGLSIGGGLRMLGRAQIDLGFTVEGSLAGASLGEGGGISGELLDLTLDVHTIRLDLTQDVVPTFGVQWTPDPFHPVLGRLTLGASFRGHGEIPVEVNLDGQLNFGADEIADLEATTLALISEIEILIYEHYLPAQANYGAAWNFGDQLSMYADVRQTFWKEMQVSVADVVGASFEATLLDLSDMETSPGNPTELIFRNTLGFYTGAELEFPRWELPDPLGWMRMRARGGFGYEPTPLVSQTSESSLVDSDRMIFAIGLGAEHASPVAMIDGPFGWDAFVQYQVLASGSVQRPDDGVLPGYPVDNAPIPTGGQLLAAGLEWSAEY
jgi:long-subunit fatty acid transport protein